MVVQEQSDNLSFSSIVFRKFTAPRIPIKREELFTPANTFSDINTSREY